MKQVLFYSFLLIALSQQTLAQKNTLIATILRETDRTPMEGVEIRLTGERHQLLTTLTTDKEGKIQYRTDNSFIGLDIRSNDLNFKSTYKEITLLPKDSTLDFCFLTKRDSEEVEQLLRGQRSLDPGSKSKLSEFCPNIITSVQDTANFKEVYRCLVSNINYPAEAQEMGIEGKIKVHFVIDEQGEILDLKIMSGSVAVLEEEALRAAACLSGMSPATCDGKKVPTMYLLPLTFRLN